VPVIVGLVRGAAGRRSRDAAELGGVTSRARSARARWTEAIVWSWRRTCQVKCGALYDNG